MERSEERHMQVQINALSEKVATLTVLQSANHVENRRDIEKLNKSQQDLLDTMTTGLEKIADKIGNRLSGIESDVLDMRMKWARATGYAIGLSAASAAIFQLVKAWLAHMGMK